MPETTSYTILPARTSSRNRASYQILWLHPNHNLLVATTSNQPQVLQNNWNHATIGNQAWKSKQLRPAFTDHNLGIMAMITNICPITGAKYSLQSIANGGNITADALHPILCTSLEQLNSIRLSAKQADNYLVFCAYMKVCADNKVVKFSRGFEYANFGDRWLQQIMPKIARLANWLALNPADYVRAKLPHYRVTEVSNGFTVQGWIESALETIENLSFAWTHNAKAVNSKSNFAKLLNATEHGTEYRDPEVVDKSSSFISGRSVARYINRSLELANFDESYIVNVRSVCLRPANYPPQVLRKVRTVIMDFGLESDIADVNDKELICANLDKALVEKVGVLELLGASTQDNADELDRIRASYTIVRNGEEFTNSAVPAARIANELGITANNPQVSFVEPAVPETEPQLADYANRALYMAALSRYNRAKRSK